MRTPLYLLIFALLFAACGQKNPDPATHQCKHDSTDKKECFNADYMMMGVLYYQKAAETRALYHQGFNLAKMLLEKDLKVKSAKTKAIVLDIDETILDNSPYEAQCILGNFSYPEKWDEWCQKAEATATPGAVDFLKYAESKGYQIFYISNRKAHLLDATLKNLSAQGFPMADTTHVMLRTKESSKEARRLKVQEKHEVVLYFGDNLADFVDAFDGGLSTEVRAAKADSMKAVFGVRHIVFPNSMYGDWEMAFYPDPAAAPAAKDSARRANLKGF